MAAGGGRATKSRDPATVTALATKRKHIKKPNPENENNGNPNVHHLDPQLLSPLSSSVSAVQAFLHQNDLLLLPSQCLSLESLLSSLSLSLSTPLPSLPSYSSSAWFHRFLCSTSDQDPMWSHCFRMSRPTFALLISLLSPSLLTALPFIAPQTAVAASLFRLAHAAPYKSVARRFGFESSSDACRAFYIVCKVVNDKLGGNLDLESDIARTVSGFGLFSFPNCCGVLGFGRFEVDGEMGNGSLLVQALVDTETRFLDISAGWPNTMKPATILHQTTLFSHMEESTELFNGSCYQLSDGNSISRYILGDSCFPLLPWLVTPYGDDEDDSSGSAARKEFNVAHRRAMQLVYTALGSVQGRWKLLAEKWREDCIEFFPFVIVMGCLLHNFLINCNEAAPEQNVVSFRKEEEPCFIGEPDTNAQRTRNALSQHLSSRKQVM